MGYYTEERLRDILHNWFFFFWQGRGKPPPEAMASKPAFIAEAPWERVAIIYSDVSLALGTLRDDIWLAVFLSEIIGYSPFMPWRSHYRWKRHIAATMDLMPADITTLVNAGIRHMHQELERSIR